MIDVVLVSSLLFVILIIKLEHMLEKASVPHDTNKAPPTVADSESLGTLTESGPSFLVKSVILSLSGEVVGLSTAVSNPSSSSFAVTSWSEVREDVVDAVEEDEEEDTDRADGLQNGLGELGVADAMTVPDIVECDEKGVQVYVSGGKKRRSIQGMRLPVLSQ